MIDEHQGQCIYENGRFRLREETDYAIIDELEDFPPIMVQMEETDDGSESQYADRRGVLHLMNQLADTNPNEQRHFYLKYRLDKVHNDNDLLRKENKQLKEENKLLLITLKQEEEVSKEIKQSIIKRIDDYIWEWEDEGTPVADEMKKLKDDIIRGYLE